MNKYFLIVGLSLVISSCNESKQSNSDQSNQPIEFEIAQEQFSQHSEECKTKEQNGCATLKASYPVLKSKDENAKEILNALNKNIYGIFAKVFKDFIPEGNLQENTPAEQLVGSFFKKHEKDQMQFEEKIDYELLNDVSIVFYNNNIMSIAQTIMTYEGGAHPNTSICYKTFEMSSGDEINVYKWLADTTALKTEILAGLKEKMNMDSSTDLKEKGFFISDQELSITKEILIEKDSISFLYNTYEIAPYAYGNFNITLPKSKVSLLD
jgi:hypothetical protein